MKKYKKILIDAILFFVIIGLTLYGVFHGEDLSGLKDAIKECNILWLIPAVPLVLFFIAGESIVIWHMLDCYGIYVKERFCFLFSATDVSCFVPNCSWRSSASRSWARRSARLLSPPRRCFSACSQGAPARRLPSRAEHDCQRWSVSCMRSLSA